MAPTSSAKRQKSHRRRWVLLTSFVAGISMIFVLPTLAFAGPPGALPEKAGKMEKSVQPAYDYDTDGCYATPAIGQDGALNGGLELGGALNGECRDESDLENTNTYSRMKCSNGWCGIVYDSYFEKDQANTGPVNFGHRHDWEHVVVWVKKNNPGRVEFVSTSCHGGYKQHSRDDMRFEGKHPKVVYHKDGIQTHCFRNANDKDEPPENHKETWQYPALVGWGGYPAGLRAKLTRADFGDASMAIKNAESFRSNLEEAKPDGIPFDPNG
jgi:hypothetical protein